MGSRFLAALAISTIARILLHKCNNCFVRLMFWARSVRVCIGYRRFTNHNQQNITRNEFLQQTPFLIASKCILNWIMGNIMLPQIRLASGSPCVFTRALQCFIDHFLDLFSSCYCSASQVFSFAYFLRFFCPRPMFCFLLGHFYNCY